MQHKIEWCPCYIIIIILLYMQQYFVNVSTVISYYCSPAYFPTLVVT